LLNDLVLPTKFYSVVQIEKSEMGGACSTTEERKVYTVFWWGNLREQIPLGGPRRRGTDNIKTDLQEV
jgi:hypothetical protein